MDAHHGNHYRLVTLDNGVVSFRHVQTGEILHGSVGPEKEARELYICAGGLSTWPQSHMTVFDIGMGCCAQLLALLDHLNDSPTLKYLTVYSFDLEKDGLTAALSARAHFASIERHHQFLEKAQATNFVRWEVGKEKFLDWHFVNGDFRHSVHALAEQNPTLRADFFFYDFFSPASHPWLWTFELFKSVFHFTQPESRLVTYSSATCVKAALAAAGWFVGTTIASGKKAQSIIASPSIKMLNQPLPEKFLNTFLTSDKPFNDAETLESRQKITSLLSLHPQFVGAMKAQK